jgi:protein-disulfide isomerase
VVIVEFADFQCGFCDKFYNETLPTIRQTYPDQVKFVYRDFPIFGEPSAQAAMAAECANEQGKFWDMHDMLFSKLHNAEVAFEISQDSLISLASDIGLDTDSFTQCMTSQRYLDEIVKDYQTAQAYGLRGTPGFVINGVVYTFGAQPFDVFDRIIKAELTRAISEGDTSAPASTGS